MFRPSSLLGAWVVPVLASAQAVVLDDPLSGSTLGNRVAGQFAASGGWQAGHQVWWDLGTVVTDGNLTLQLFNWNPNSDSPQHQYDKQHIIALYESAHGSPHQSDNDSPKGSFVNVRTGASYNNLFKFLSTTAGFDPPPYGRIENRISRPLGFIDPAKTTTLEIRWTPAGDVTVSLDGTTLVTHSHGRRLRLRYLFVGTDNAPPGTYGPQKDVIYRNVRVSSFSPAAPDAGTPIDGGVAPIPDGGAGRSSVGPEADTWSEPGNPTATHGTDPDLRAGGDGRTIYLRFDVQGVGGVRRATVLVQAMNAGGGGEIRRVPDNTWSEATLNHLNRPAPSATILDALGYVTIGGVYSFDVTRAISGDGLYSFAITSNQVDGCGYNSRESGQTQPELVIETAPPGPGDDAGSEDAGGPDAGEPGDGGSLEDGGGPEDTPRVPGPGSPDPRGGRPVQVTGGCGCRGPGDAAWSPVSALAFTVPVARRGLRGRRRRESGSASPRETPAAR